MRRLVGKLGGRARLGLLALGFALLLPPWVMASQPFSPPDEASHYLRAVSIANGHLLGPKAKYHNRGLDPTQLRMTSYDTRLVWVKPAMLPNNVGCYDGKPDVSGCWAATPEGNFPPLPYLLPALAIKVSGNDITTAVYLSRAAEALPSLLLLLMAIAVLWEGTALSVLGLLAAATPMVLFSSSIVSSSGPEITGSLALSAAVLRTTREPADTPGWVFSVLAIGGCVSILSGPIGLLFAAAFLLLGVVLLARDGLIACWRQRRTPLLRAAGALLIATILALIWRRESGIVPALFSIHPLFTSLHHGLDQLPDVLRGSLGIFGSLTVVLPGAVYWLGFVFELLLIGAALWFARPRDRVVVAAVTLLALALPVLLWAWSVRLLGFALQGREVLPILMLIPLVSGEAIRRGGRVAALTRPGARRVLAGALVAIAVFQAYCWWFNARAMAGSPGTLRFWAHATWSPPLGWYPWIAFTVAGVLSFVMFAAGELVTDRVTAERPVAVPA